MSMNQIVIGSIESVASGRGQLRLDRAAVASLANQADVSTALAASIGGQVKIKVGNRWVLGKLRESRLDHTSTPPTIAASIDFVGEGLENADGSLGNFHRGIASFPRAGDAVVAVNHADLVALFGARGRPNIEVGTVYPTNDVRAALFIDPLLGKHFALLGSTGSGKSTATALILHRIVDAAPHGHVVVLDPHGEYGAAFTEKGVNFNVDNLEMPYWLMNFEEHCEVFIASEGSERDFDKAILAEALLKARSRSSLASTFSNLTVDSPVPYPIYELLGALDVQLGKLDNSSEIARYLRLKNRIDQIMRDSRFNFMFRRELAVDSMHSFLSRILRLDGDGKPISIVDLSGVPSEIVAVVVALLSRIVMDYAMWSRSEESRPILLVCEEAHRYVPAATAADASPAARKVLERIAKEGRKYGVSLALVSQRPSDIAEGVLSQCGTIISMRLNNERDQACVRNAMPDGGRSFVDQIPALSKGECIICGEGVAVPMQVHFDLPAENCRPSSDDPSFSAGWQAPSHDSGSLDRSIKRWRSQSYSLANERPAERVSLLLRPVSAMAS
jgi:DNA helicase HerA-like ATPase